jgi:capsular polysaccharide transport system ATP-binding protein
MIHLIDVAKAYEGPNGLHDVIRPVSMTIPTNRQVAVLGYNGAGKSTLLRLISGVEDPDQGQIIRDCRVSWPLGFSGGLHNELTGVENAVFIARIYGSDVDEVIRFVYDFSELGDYMRMPVRTYSSGMKARLTFGLSMAIDFDCYLVDELTAVGDRTFKNKAQRAFRERARRSGLLFVSHDDQSVRQYCEVAMVIDDGYIYAFSDMDTARRFYRQVAERRNRKTTEG